MYNPFFDLYADYLKNILRLLLIFLENVHNLCYANFYFYSLLSAGFTGAPTIGLTPWAKHFRCDPYVQDKL